MRLLTASLLALSLTATALTAGAAHAAPNQGIAAAFGNTVKALYGRMKSRQPAYQQRPPAYTEPDWQLEYEI